jgi:hypothetical protein
VRVSWRQVIPGFQRVYVCFNIWAAADDRRRHIRSTEGVADFAVVVAAKMGELPVHSSQKDRGGGRFCRYGLG